MPFKSDQQRKACFATDGFGGKVDCRAWAEKSKGKKLPKKVKNMSKQKMSEMRAYGLPRDKDVENPDNVDIKNFGLKTSAGGKDMFKNKAAKKATRRIFKKKARKEGKNQAKIDDGFTGWLAQRDPELYETTLHKDGDDKLFIEKGKKDACCEKCAKKGCGKGCGKMMKPMEKG